MEMRRSNERCHISPTAVKIVIYLLLVLLPSCGVFAPKPSNELEGLTQDVLRRKEGIDIQINPIVQKRF